jgi:hypothetical protein
MFTDMRLTSQHIAQRIFLLALLSVNIFLLPQWAKSEEANNQVANTFLEKYLEYALNPADDNKKRIFKFKVDLLPPKLVPIPQKSITPNIEDVLVYVAGLSVLGRHFQPRSPLKDQQIKVFNAEDFIEFLLDKNKPHSSANGMIVVNVGNIEELRVIIYRNVQSLSKPALMNQIKEFEDSTTKGTPYCKTVRKMTPKGTEIVNVFIYIQTEANFGKCFNASIFEAFGLNKRNKENNSILDHSNQRRRPSDFDWMLWNFHNHPLIKHGMTRADVLAVADQILSQSE